MRTGNNHVEVAGMRFMLAGRTKGALLGPRAAPEGWFLERLLWRAIRIERGSVGLRRLLCQSRLKPHNIHLMTDKDLVQVLTRLISVGEIRLTPTRWWTRGGIRGAGASGGAQSATTGGKAVTSTSDPAEDRRDRRMRSTVTPTDRPFPPASQQPDPKNWIEFQLVDHETDEPIANVPFRISLPDGAVAEHTSDGNGMIRIDDLPPGYCDIKAILDRDGFEVVRLV